MSEQKYKSEVIIIGGGLAGLVTAYECLDHNKQVLLIEKSKQQDFGGQAKESFGGIHMIDTPHQRRLKIKDNPELAFQDWERVAQFQENDIWPKKWAKFYCENSREYIYDFLDHKKIKFLPLLNWPERGLYRTGNSLPRWHVTWGTGSEIISKMIHAIEHHQNYKKLNIHFEHEVSGFKKMNGRVIGVYGKKSGGENYTASGEHIVIACGGICGGDLSKLRENWHKPWGSPPDIILNGGYPYSDGKLHDKAKEIGAQLTHLDNQWNYISGIHHPLKRRPNDGISLVPPRSALWMNALGHRIGPTPLVGNTDGRYMVETIIKQPGQYSWQVMNRKVAAREMAVSGSDYMTAFRTKNKMLLIYNMLFGNQKLVDRLIKDCPDDIVVAHSLSELMDRMDEKSLYGNKIDRLKMEGDIKNYDAQIDRGPSFHNDEQLRWIANFRTYIGDKIRICNFQKILDKKAFPLIAIREFILSRKSLGGIQTDLSCRVLSADGSSIEGLYAVGEAAGFGGGGIHGVGALEGTFLGGCVLTGRVAGKFIGSLLESKDRCGQIKNAANTV